MKKLIVSLSLGVLLAAGFLFTQDPVDLTSDDEPSVLSIGNTIGF